MTERVSDRAATAQQVASIAPAALAIAVVIGVLHESTAAIVDTWYESSTFGHGFLIVPICFYLAWRKRGEVVSVAPRPNVWGIVAVAAASLAWLVGHCTATVVVEEISLVSIIVGAVLAVYGWPLWRVFAFPLLYLYFAVPTGEIAVPRLQSITADMAIGLLRITGVPVFADGNVISIPNGSWFVAEACSGVRFLIASIALGTLFAGVTFQSWWRRGCFVGLSVTVPIMANGLRVYAIILIAYVAGNERAGAVDHVVFGWVFFSMVTMLLLAIGRLMSEPNRAAPGSVDPRPAKSGSFGLGPRQSVSLALTLAPVLLASAYAAHVDGPQIPRSVRLTAPEVGGRWRDVADARDALTPAFAAPSARLDCAYDRDGARVYLHIGYYLEERRGAQAVGFGHTLIPDKGWTPSVTFATTTTLGEDQISVQAVRAVSGHKVRLIWYWYWVDGHFTGNPYVAKFLQAKAKLLGGQTAAAVIVAATDYDDDQSGAGQSLADFMSNLRGLRPVLNRALPEPHANGS